jgi:mycothiol synthase
MTIRPIVPDDAVAIARLIRADEEALRGKRSHVAVEDVRMWWSRTDLGNDSWLFEEDGALVAAGWFELHGDVGTFVGAVAHGAKGRGLGSSLVDRGEARALEREAAKIHTWVLPEDERALELLSARGYRAVRRFYEMAIDLADEPRVSGPPSPLVLESFRESDARAFHEAMDDAFRDHWEWHGMPFDEWWAMRRDNDHSLWFVVRDGDEIAAAVRNEAREASGYVGMLGVGRAWRGCGLGKALLHRTFAEFWRRGLPRVTLGVDAESPTGATQLYESVGMALENETVVYEKVPA